MSTAEGKQTKKKNDIFEGKKKNPFYYRQQKYLQGYSCYLNTFKTYPCQSRVDKKQNSQSSSQKAS